MSCKLIDESSCSTSQPSRPLAVNRSTSRRAAPDRSDAQRPRHVKLTYALRTSIQKRAQAHLSGELPPIHPGQLVRDALLTPTRMRVRTLAVRLDMERDLCQLEHVLERRLGIGSTLARKLELYMGVNEKSLFALQDLYNAWLYEASRS